MQGYGKPKSRVSMPRPKKTKIQYAEESSQSSGSRSHIELGLHSWPLKHMVALQACAAWQYGGLQQLWATTAWLLLQSALEYSSP